MPSKYAKKLKCFQNPQKNRDYEIFIDTTEFTCLCPLTGQPDFARIIIKYIPDKLCVELKSLKLYLGSYRNQGAFHEKVVNQILNDIIKTISPRKINVIGIFNIRGGIKTTVKVSYP
ncbi:MAG: preQ(1) synthase [Candidatus Hydrogenedentota bacterium]